MRRPLLLALLLSLTAGPVRSGYPVTVIASPADEIRWISQELPQWLEQIAETRALVRNANSLVRYAGDAPRALGTVENIAEVMTELRAMLGESRQVEELARLLSAEASLEAPPNRSRPALARAVETLQGLQPRDTEAWREILGLEQAVVETRKLLVRYRTQQDDIARKLVSAGTRLERGGTDAEMQTAQAEIARLHVALDALKAASEVVLKDLELKEKERSLGAEIESRAAAEAQALQAEARQTAVRQVAIEHRKKMLESLRPGTSVAPDSRSMFNLGGDTGSP